MRHLTNKGMPDWDALLAEYPFLAEMESCPQDPEWHGEGNVRIHSEMVCHELSEIPAYQELDKDDQEIVMLAAAFHDNGKPLTTVKENGRWVSPRHASAGAKRLRYWWWANGCPFPLEKREQILNLVRYHAVPVHFFVKGSPESVVIERSYSLRNDLLGLLAEADMRGRKGHPDSQFEAIAACQLYLVQAEELACLKTPYVFSNDHARFCFSRAEHKDHRYHAFDDREFTITVAAGMPGAGKSTFMADLKMPMVSLDQIRDDLDIDPRDNQGEVIQAAFAKAREFMRTKTPFAWDGTNLSRVQRDGIVQLGQAYGARFHLHWFDADRALCLKRNRKRPNKAKIPEAVLDRLAGKIEFPTYLEVHRLEIRETK
jgi:predicted kinase